MCEYLTFFGFGVVLCGLVIFRVYVMKLLLVLSLVNFMTRFVSYNELSVISYTGMKVSMHVSNCVRRGVISSARAVTQS